MTAGEEEVTRVLPTLTRVSETNELAPGVNTTSAAASAANNPSTLPVTNKGLGFLMGVRVRGLDRGLLRGVLR